MKKYFIHVPGWVYAMTAYGVSKRDCIDKFKRQYDMTRMPKGYAIWEA